MAHQLRGTHRTALLIAVALAATTLAAPAPPAAAVTSEFGTSTPTYFGDIYYRKENLTPITVPAVGDVGPASPYPTQIVIPHPATILDVNITIHGLTSTAPGDLNVLLVGPGGQQALVMSDVGGTSDVSGVTFTFDDDALTTLGDGAIDFGTYKPLNQGGDADEFPSPAPPLTGNSALSVFNGTIAGGVWSLYIVDDQTSDGHTMLGWSLRFTLATRPYPSTVQVGGLGPVSDVNVKLRGLTSPNPDDMHLLLVGPGGQQSYLIGDAGGSTDITNLDVTVDDEAGAAFPDSTTITGGAYRPTRYGVRSFPAPAPVTSGSASLSVFDGLDPDGEWRLFSLDDPDLGAGSLAGWSLEFTWADTTSPIGTVSINGGADSTGSRLVTVDLGATDPDPTTGVASVRLSNDGVAFSPYQPYAASLAWTLPEGEGDKRVYAQFKDGAGNESAIVSDVITLDTGTTNPDTTGPRATKLTPRKKATDVNTTTKVKVKASEALRKGTVSTKTVSLKEQGVAGKVPAKVTYQGAKRTLVITPRSPLDRHTTYVVTVRRVKDRAGNAWDQKPTRPGAQPLTYSFTTG